MSVSGFLCLKLSDLLVLWGVLLRMGGVRCLLSVKTRLFLLSMVPFLCLRMVPFLWLC